MSNVIPYFVLAIVAVGFFAICYAVFSRGDGESQPKQKAHKNVNADNHIDEQHDIPTATESKHGDVTITHAGGTNVYTASIADSTEGQSGKVLHDGPVEILHDDPAEVLHNEPAEALVDSTDTSFNRRDGKHTHVENTSTSYSLALDDHNAAVTSTESTGNQGTPLMDKTIVLDKVTDELRNRVSSVEDTIAMGESVEVLAADEAENMEVTQMIGGADDVQTADGPSVLDETRLFDASEIEEQLAAASLVDEEVPTGQWARAAHDALS